MHPSVLLLAGLLISGCGDHSSSAPGHQNHEATHEAAPEAPTAAGAGLGLQLNDGARWQMDQHTRMVFGKIRDTLASAQISAPTDIAPLSENLSTLQQELISGCTMEGAAHDQLHLFLMAWMPALEELGKQTDGSGGQESLESLRGLVAEYDKHFE